jgi:hypothetical protein
MDASWPARTHQGSFHLTPVERLLVVFGRVVSTHARQEKRSSPRVAQTVPNVNRLKSVLLGLLPTRAHGSRKADRRRIDGVCASGEVEFCHPNRTDDGALTATPSVFRDQIGLHFGMHHRASVARTIPCAGDMVRQLFASAAAFGRRMEKAVQGEKYQNGPRKSFRPAHPATFSIANKWWTRVISSHEPRSNDQWRMTIGMMIFRGQRQMAFASSWAAVSGWRGGATRSPQPLCTAVTSTIGILRVLATPGPHTRRDEGTTIVPIIVWPPKREIRHVDSITPTIG